MLSVWLRAIRVRFLLSSVIATSTGLSIAWWNYSTLNVFDAILTMTGVVLLHASVDLLNDYWDFKRGIDIQTPRTKMSGGTGVLPEGLLDPKSVYWVGVALLICGSAIGVYFVILHGWIIAALLGFAIISIYFYSTRIVDSGMAEVFVAIKGAMIVLGAYFIQTDTLGVDVGMGGAIVGVLSSLVLFVTSFPDHDADRAHGRKTLVIIAGKKRACLLYWIFLGLVCGLVLVGVLSEVFYAYVFCILFLLPLGIHSGWSLGKNYSDTQAMVPVMSHTILYSRLTGVALVLSFVVSWFDPLQLNPM